jgi:SAM-dependent methyltransferase
MNAVSEANVRAAAHARPEEAYGMPGSGLGAQKMPGHWLLARVGKRVLRPGGIELTKWLIDALGVSAADSVVELAPGLGVTARMLLERKPHSYLGIDRDPAAAASIMHRLAATGAKCLVGHAEATGLPRECATVVLAEAMLSMQPDSQKQRIVAEAHRILRPEGRYGIHELCLSDDDLHQSHRDVIERDLSQSIHVGVRPLTPTEWRDLLRRQGFEVVAEHRTPMHLLEPRRMIADEGLGRFVRILFNLLRDNVARERVRAMRAVFRRHGRHLSAIALVAKRTDAKPFGGN